MYTLKINVHSGPQALTNYCTCYKETCKTPINQLNNVHNDDPEISHMLES